MKIVAAGVGVLKIKKRRSEVGVDTRTGPYDVVLTRENGSKGNMAIMCLPSGHFLPPSLVSNIA